MGPAIERTYSVRELHEGSGLSESSIYRAMADGRLPYILPNGSKTGRRVRESAWVAFMESIEVHGSPPMKEKEQQDG